MFLHSGPITAQYPSSGPITAQYPSSGPMTAQYPSSGPMTAQYPSSGPITAQYPSPPDLDGEGDVEVWLGAAVVQHLVSPGRHSCGGEH